MMGWSCARALQDLNAFVTIGVMRRVIAGEDVAQAELDRDRRCAAGAIGRAGPVAPLVLAVVLFCLFMPRANRNARAFGSLMTTSPGWAAGWFFVPIAELVEAVPRDEGDLAGERSRSEGAHAMRMSALRPSEMVVGDVPVAQPRSAGMVHIAART